MILNEFEFIRVDDSLHILVKRQLLTWSKSHRSCMRKT